MQRNEADMAKAKVMSFHKKFGADIRRDPNSYVGGNPDGDVTLVEFFDYRCGYCKKAHPIVVELLKTDKNIRMVYKEFPILGPQSKLAAVAAIAALRLDSTKYYDFHNALITARGALSHQAVLDIAAEAGLDPAALTAAMKDPEIKRIIAQNYRQAKLLGINGTPGFVIGDSIVPGFITLAQMRDLIQEARAECTTC
jgi:protein-disulfide isomerase